MKKRVFVFGLTGFFLTAVETGLLSSLGLNSIALHLSLGILLFAAVNAGDLDGALIAAIIGYGWDIFSGIPAGLSVAPAVGIFVFVRTLSQGLDMGGVLQILLVGFTGSLFLGLCNLCLLSITGLTGELIRWHSIKMIFFQSFAVSVAAVPVYFMTNYIDELFFRDRSDREGWLS